jgi:hypothetical protein
VKANASGQRLELHTHSDTGIDDPFRAMLPGR